MKWGLALFLLLILFMPWGRARAQEEWDPYSWLEEVLGQKSLAWVTAQNKESIARLEAVPVFQDIYKKTLEILNSPERIPYPTKYGDYLYNFWRDAEHVRGIWRRTTLSKYRKKDPQWEVILDIDSLARQEGENWIYTQSEMLYPEYNRCLIFLSRGGSDAFVVREFDIPTKSFVKDGFQLPEAKSFASWMDRDTLFVCTDFGEGSLTDSGYPRIVKLWKRGTALAEALTIFQGEKASVMVNGSRIFSKDGNIDLISEVPTFFKSVLYVRREGKLFRLDLPADSEVRGYYKKQLLVLLKSDWNVGGRVFKQGALISGKVDDILAGKKAFQLLMEPTERSSIQGVETTKSYALVTIMDNVVDILYRIRQDEKGRWSRSLIRTEGKGTLSIFNTDENLDDFFINYQDFLTPTGVLLMSAKTGKMEKLRSLPDFFSPKPYHVLQFEAVSADGTRVPYFIVMRRNVVPNEQNPTLLHAYGGFASAMQPFYLSTIGSVWLNRGGVYVLANVRGGGEFGPKWHLAGIKKNRLKVVEDFIAVAEDLIKRKITSPQELGIMGGSNGGLLVGAAFVLRPDLFKAVVCQAPLLDMKRYSKLSAGASWMDEYGDPGDPDMWSYIKSYSPYHNIKLGVKYPAVLFTTSTRDDRVHPGHARKMAAKMKEMGHEVYYYENIEGGHTGAANNQQRAYMGALSYAFLFDQLMEKHH